MKLSVKKTVISIYDILSHNKWQNIHLKKTRAIVRGTEQERHLKKTFFPNMKIQGNTSLGTNDSRKSQSEQGENIQKTSHNKHGKTKSSSSEVNQSKF